MIFAKNVVKIDKRFEVVLTVSEKFNNGFTNKNVTFS